MAIPVDSNQAGRMVTGRVIPLEVCAFSMAYWHSFDGQITALGLAGVLRPPQPSKVSCPRELGTIPIRVPTEPRYACTTQTQPTCQPVWTVFATSGRDLDQQKWALSEKL